MPRELYEKQEWENLPSQETPVSAERLLHLEEGIYKNSEDKALKEIYGDAEVSMGRTGTVGKGSFAFGRAVTASGSYSHVEGENSKASGIDSHAEGGSTEAKGSYSHTEGFHTTAGNYAHAEGSYTLASGAYSHVQGRYNVEDKSMEYAHIIGGGTSTTDRKNIHTVDWDGNAWFAGTVESTGIILTDTVTEQKYIITIADGNLEITPVA